MATHSEHPPAGMRSTAFTAPEYRIRNLQGEVVEGILIIPDFCAKAGIDVAAVTAAVKACPTRDPSKPLTRQEAPAWVSGEATELRYRGHAVRRDKMWLQKDVSKALRYGYTGWQWGVTAGTYALDSLPPVAAAVERVQEVLELEPAHNHWIVTRYETGDDGIGLHSDKVKDWVPDSCFGVLKLGAARPFVITQEKDVEGGKTEDVEIARVTLPEGAAVIMSMEANKRYKHGVPPVKPLGWSGEGGKGVDVGWSGSIVGRAIATELSWEHVDREVSKRRKVA